MLRENDLIFRNHFQHYVVFVLYLSAQRNVVKRILVITVTAFVVRAYSVVAMTTVLKIFY